MDLLGNWGGIEVAVEADLNVATGHQWLLFSIAGGGQLLAMLLDPEWEGSGRQALTPDGRWARVAHTAAVDERLKRLVDLVAHLRQVAPGLVQLTLTGMGGEGA